jgi:hypothetical protein
MRVHCQRDTSRLYDRHHGLTCTCEIPTISPHMPKALKTPEFKTEDDEARWWKNNQSLLLNEFEQAAKDGTLSHGTLMRRKGQTYLKMVIHQALAQEAGKPASTAKSKR